MIKNIIVIVSFLILQSNYSSAYYNYDKNLEAAYSSILKLKFDEAKQLLDQEKIEKPGNDLTYLFLNYIDFLKAFISEDISDYDQLKKNSTIYLDKLELDKNNPESPFHLYVKAEMSLQLAIVRIKFEDNIVAANEIRKAYKLIHKNAAMFPTFILNDKISGLLDVMIGSIPDQYHWMVKIGGMDGNITKGLEKINDLYDRLALTEYSGFRPELLFYIGNIYSSLSYNLKSVHMINDLKSSSLNSPLLAYVYSNMLLKEGKNDEALSILNQTLGNNNSYPFTFLYYKKGVAKLRKLDFSSETDFKYFIANYKGSNNIKSAHQKLAWIYLLKGDTTSYIEEIKKCLQNGNDLLDEDRAALYEAKKEEIINSYLLNARLYFDGGYYDKALSELAQKKVGSFPRYHDQLEVTYRLGRIMHMTGKIDKAIEYLEMTLKNGLSSEYYFAANSALFLGIIYEDKLQFDLAGSYYRKCLSIQHEQYKNSIDQKAKAGLDRIKKKTGGKK